MPKGEAIIDFTFNGEVKQIIPEFQKLNLEHENYIDIRMTALAGYMCIYGFKKRTKTSQSSVLPTSERRSPSLS